MKFVAPVLMLLFSLSFLGAWLLERTRSHLLLFAFSYLCVGLAALGQVTFWPHDIGLNTVASITLYCLGVLLLGEGVLRRSGRKLARALPVLIAALVLVGIVYFFYVDRSLVARAYILNFGLGTILLIIAWQARFLRFGEGTDRAMFWLVVAVGLHFFPRTMLTISAFSGGNLDAFGASTFWTWVQITLSLLGAGTALGLLGVTSVDVVTALRGERDNDPLTGLLNRRGLEWRSRSLHGESARKTSSLVVCDIDNFKAVNDTYGHAAGDAVLVGFAGVIRKVARSEDIIARIGGEEFVVVLKGKPLASAYRFAERLRLEIQQTRLDGLPAETSITCSIGVVELRQGADLWAAVERADEYLYAAKKAGRNRTFMEGQALPAPA
ncbi:GGDEF domain-containing protein [Mesorhizobium sp. KR1-2]|uniref:GGDEF domain-containing protein n=1 Tax=Mesorhizobium sp. KR1-2 TaxID=3156609 RepID=UPI0032B32DC6